MSEVPREFVGLARDFVERVHKENEATLRVVRRVEATVIEPRIGGRGKHTLRPEHVRQIERIWRDMPETFRIGPTVFDHPKHGLRIEEMRLQALRRNLGDWTDRDKKEPAIAVSVMLATVERKEGWHYRWREYITIGLHALARRYERGDGRDDAAILRDIEALVDASCELAKSDSDLSEVAIPCGCRWRGTVSMADVFGTSGRLHESHASLAIRTFLPPILR